MNHCIVAIVGRPNVGKSALFNRLTGKARAIVDDQPGVTRDRNYGLAEWLGRKYMLVDTGGFEPDGSDNILNQIRDQAALAMQEADVILIVADGRQVLDRADRELAERLRGTGKPVLLAVNKIDNQELESEAHNFWSLGVGTPYPVSALHGRRVDELLDALIEVLPLSEELPDDEEDSQVKLAIVGRPNVGKSSLLNRILGETRVLVSDIPGTTRDSVSSFFEFQNRSFQILDTAGLRVRSRVEAGVEKYSVMRALRSIEECHAAVLMLDASVPLSEQDERIAGFIHEAGRACILAINKWDLIEKDQHTVDQYMKILRARLSFMEYAPSLTLSAKTGQRVNHLLEMAMQVDEQHKARIKTSLLNKALQDIIHKHPAPSRRGRVLKLKFLTQTGVRPPAFALFVNEARRMHFSYLRYVKNSLRAHFGFQGTPLIVMLREAKGARRD
ncbi:ribosome biogenesis GTPase Der [bacterium]|nr:ribosome biogenesis GTPase Der [bacterium]